MAYCCKCGVALDEHVEMCPLCHFEIPEDLVEKKNKVLPYPKAINAHVDNLGTVKNKILYSYAMISFAVVLILLVLNSIITPTHQYFQYAVVGIVASILYLFLFLGYIKRLTYILTCLGVLTCLCVFF